jgi:hypothetical protein
MVFREISIPFAGREYVVTPSNKLLRRIEIKGRREDPRFNLVEVFFRATTMTGAFYDMAFVLAELINASGGDVTEDQALAEFVEMKDAKALADYISLICSCVMPEAKAKEGNGEGSETQKAA